MNHADTRATRLRAPKPRHLAVLAHVAVLTGFPAAAALAQEAAAGAETQSLPAVTVSATAVDDAGLQLQKKASTGALGSRTQLDTPYSTTIVTGEDLADRQVSKLGDVFAMDASVTDNSNAYNSWSSYLTVRGLQVDWQNGFKINGLPFVAYGITLPYEHMEQVELLKGLPGFMYGFGTPGGIVNYVTKKPTDTFTASFELGYRAANVWSEHIDLGGRAGPDNMFGYRLNYTHEEGTPYNARNVNRDTVSLGLDARLTKDLTWTFDSIYHDRRTTGQMPSFSFWTYTDPALPAAVSGRIRNFAGSDQHLNTNLQLYTTGLRYQVNPDWAVSTNYSFSKVNRSRNESLYGMINQAGDYTDTRYDTAQNQQVGYWQAMLEGKFRTGPFGHQLVAGLSWQKQIDRYDNNGFAGTIGTGNIFEPNTNTYFSSTAFNKVRNSDITQKSIFASDTVQLSERWSVLAGLRVTNFEQNGYVPAATNYTKNGVVTPTLALMFKPVPAATVYASYVEALEPGSIVPDGYTNARQLLSPIRSKQYELGVKADQQKWSATAALFRIERGAEYDSVSNGVPTRVQDGSSIYQGVELAGVYRLGSQWEFGGSAMYLDTYYDKGNANLDNRVAGAPELVLAGRISYLVPYVPGLRVGVDGKYTGNIKVNATNTLDAGGYTVFNLGATYNTRVYGKDLTLRAALNNLTNKRYWGYQYENYLQPGDPRSVSLTARIAY
ncbi:TonB-dependent siderophore receptor [Cupriavidus oxalaticus]|uniref:TonB-dependent siderophore receptor n=1 Tax=Cupriavidus oxalaticus TaxID=96344 RepID=A0ABX7HLI6_9BURK|nr:TonB-dependent siderophore receptor [Cupriavidus oxalaticus]QRQ84623.1 TonB-dependent siderophore receptor [Cupriavidus oxalaticus]QRQ91288.1 TonB-dependent siderophore receptor [Cupriavidus oxalaticus]WQD85845.1 TonB-dependent siderophore receptor [Cupriavidus oxalaticus]